MATYTLSEFAELVGVSTHTLQRWDNTGRLVADRTPTNRRQYTERHLAQVWGKINPTAVRRLVVYCRVSSAGQKADLANQRQRLEQFCAGRGLAVDEWIEEIGGGLNFNRKRFLNLVDRIVAGEIETVVIAHKDRLVRFGYALIEHLCEVANCQLIVMNTETLSPEREMVEDLMTIVHCFSSRLYGLRHYRKALKRALNDDQSA
jgi:predicted site-specific integrase-resolvase